MTLRALRLNKLLSNINNVPSVVRFKHVWSSDNVVKSPFEDVVVPELTVDEYVWRNLEKWPTKTAAFCGVTNRSYTYEEIYKQSRTLAANLIKKFKVQNGDVIGVISHNIPEYPTITFGILAAGGVMTTFNPLYTEHEVQRQLELSDVKLMIAYEDYIPVVKEAFKHAKKNIPIISIRKDKPLLENVTSFQELVEDNHIDLSILKQVNRTPSDIAIIPYSSGTTGLPKGVELTNRNLVANFEQQNTGIRQYRYTKETHQDTALVILPLFHLYGLGIIMLHKMSAGVKLLTLPKFQPDTFLNSLKVHRSNIVYLVPPMVLFLGTSPQVTPEHLASVRSITVGAAPLPVADAEKMISRSQNSNLIITQGYGMTEAGPLVTMTLPDRTNYESAGYPLPNIKLRVVDDNMKNLGPCQVSL
ncbi:unnamed protein product [Diatraea saccharalis]|uniref:AMP-dependent synthetase/ligase domain-containing protein n=1 Tax=Diatraea saccharalis TaxID=40085 RepID=A0A9N9R1Y5_9NEOP|nr:unnamed protein product [Diatraea saccharalis]